MAVYIRYIKLSGDYDKIEKQKETTKDVARHKGTLKYLTK